MKTLNLDAAREAAARQIKSRCARGQCVQILLGVAEPGWDLFEDALELYAQWLVERDEIDPGSLLGGVTYHFPDGQGTFTIRQPTVEEKAALVAGMLRTWYSGRHLRKATARGIAQLLEVLAQRSRRGLAA